MNHDHGEHHHYDHHHHEEDRPAELSLYEKLVMLLKHYIRHSRDHARPIRTGPKKVAVESKGEVPVVLNPDIAPRLGIDEKESTL
jgi:hypothetical protein